MTVTYWEASHISTSEATVLTKIGKSTLPGLNCSYFEPQQNLCKIKWAFATSLDTTLKPIEVTLIITFFALKNTRLGFEYCFSASLSRLLLTIATTFPAGPTQSTRKIDSTTIVK